MRALWILFLLASAVALLGGGIPAAIIVIAQKRGATLTTGAVVTLAIVELILGAIDLAIGLHSYREVTVPGAREGGLLTAFLGLVAIVGLVMGPLLITAGILQLANLRVALWIQWVIAGLYAVMFLVPLLFMMT